MTITDPTEAVTSAGVQLGLTQGYDPRPQPDDDARYGLTARGALAVSAFAVALEPPGPLYTDPVAFDDAQQRWLRIR